MNVVWTKAALKQLRSIHDYIAADSIGYAKRLTDRLVKRSEQFANSPESGGRVLEYDKALSNNCFNSGVDGGRMDRPLSPTERRDGY
jgi:hypothetical protein